MNMIRLNGRPAVKNLGQILSEWLVFRRRTIERKLKFRLDKILARLHILEGLKIAYLNIDEVIQIIRNSDHPKKDLIKAFGLSEIQAKAILEIRLRQLAKLEEIKIISEMDELNEQRKFLEKILNSPKAFKAYMIDEIKTAAKLYGDKRRSPIKERKGAEAFSVTDVLDIEPVTIILSANGWIRAAKGHEINPENVKFKTGDSLMCHLRTRSDKPIALLDNKGRSYTLYSHTLPSARSNGEPLTGHLTLAPGSMIQHIISGDPQDPYLVGSDNGYGFIIEFADFLTNYKNGKAVISLKDGIFPLTPEPVPDFATDMILAITNKGRLLIFTLNQLPRLKKGKGNKIIAIPKPDETDQDPEKLKFLKILPLNSNLVIHSGKHFLRLSPGNQIDYTGMRGRRGKLLPRGYRSVDNVEVISLQSADNTNS